MKLNYNEIKRYYDRELLNSMRLSLGLSWDSVAKVIFNHIICLQSQVDSIDEGCGFCEYNEGQIEELTHQVEVLQLEIVAHKELNEQYKEDNAEWEERYDQVVRDFGEYQLTGSYSID